MGNPSLTEKSIIGYEVVPTIAHDPAKCPGTKRIQTEIKTKISLIEFQKSLKLPMVRVFTLYTVKSH